jgi:hypothetical protein
MFVKMRRLVMMLTVPGLLLGTFPEVSSVARSAHWGGRCCPSPLLMHSACMPHQVTCCASSAAKDDADLWSTSPFILSLARHCCVRRLVLSQGYPCFRVSHIASRLPLERARGLGSDLWSWRHRCRTRRACGRSRGRRRRRLIWTSSRVGWRAITGGRRGSIG